MAKRRPKKPMLKFPKRMQKKMIVMFTVVAALMIGLIGRLMYIEYTSGENMRKSFWHSRAMTARQFLIREVTL